jgi:hypothetical protein
MCSTFTRTHVLNLVLVLTRCLIITRVVRSSFPTYKYWQKKAKLNPVFQTNMFKLLLVPLLAYMAQCAPSPSDKPETKRLIQTDENTVKWMSMDQVEDLMRQHTNFMDITDHEDFYTQESGIVAGKKIHHAVVFHI